MSTRLVAAADEAWSPSTLDTSPGVVAIFEFDATDAVLSGTRVESVVNSLDRSQFLTVRSASGGNPVVVAGNSGAKGTSQVLQFKATTQDPNIYDTATNWLSAGGIYGAAGSALVDLVNSPDLATSGSFTTIIALKIDTAYRYEAGPIWGALASPGPLQYAQLRINGGNVQGADLTASDGVAANAGGSVTAGWHVMTMIKSDGKLTYRLDGKTVQTTVITSNNSFTATDFLIGGGFPQGPTADLSQENGVPPPDIGEFQAYSGALAGNDLINAESMAGASIGLSLPSASSSGTLVRLPDTPTVYAAHNGDTVYAGAGAATVTAGSGTVDMYGGSGPLWFIGGSAASEVTGSSGGERVIGGSGGGSFGGGSTGGNVLVAGGSRTTLTGGGDGDRLFGSASGQDVMTAAHGRESLIGGGGSTTMTGGTTAGAVIFTSGNTTVTGGSAGGDTVVGGAGNLVMHMHDSAVFGGSGATLVTGGTSGADSIIGGSGGLTVIGEGSNMVVAGGSGASSINTGSGANLIFTGAGTMSLEEGAGAGTVVLGAGHAQISQSVGAILYEVVNGAAGGVDAISGYRPGTDRIALFGYGAETASVQIIGANSVLALSDGTRITLLGVVAPGEV